LLLDYGADKRLKNYKGEVASDICTYSNINELLGSNDTTKNSQGHQDSNQFVPSYIKYAPLNPQVDVGPHRVKQPDFLSMPKTSLPAALNNDGKYCKKISNVLLILGVLLSFFPNFLM